MLKVKNIKPLFTKLITTANRYEKTEKLSDNLIDVNKLEGRYKEYQKVISVGSAVRDIKEGDLVVVNPARYMKKKYDENSLRNDFVENPVVEVIMPVVEMDGEDYFMLEQNDIEYVISEYEEVEEPKDLG